MDKPMLEEWTVHNGLFVPYRPEPHHGHRLHQIAIRGAEQLKSTFPSIQSVYLTGSGLTAKVSSKIRDLDVLVISEGALEQDVLTDFINDRSPEQTPWDIRLIDLKERLTPQNAMYHLHWQLRSMLLLGDDSRPDDPQIFASPQLAQYLLTEHIRPLIPLLQLLKTTPVVEYLPWVQKRTLRLFSFHALAQLGRFSRHPVDCASYCEILFPHLHRGALEVLDDYIEEFNGKAYSTIVLAQEILKISLGSNVQGIKN